MGYPKSYHRAIQGLINYPYDPQIRPVIAAALRDMRKVFDRTRTRSEYYHMFFVAPFPVKTSKYTVA
jgi:hypothetical protein